MSNGLLPAFLDAMVSGWCRALCKLFGCVPCELSNGREFCTRCGRS